MAHTKSTNKRAGFDFNLALLPALVELIAAVNVASRIRELRLSALWQLHGQLARYKELGYTENILYDIAEKKGWMILEISSKEEMDRLMRPRVPHFDGNRFVPDAYHVPEEELICWSEASLSTQLNEKGYKRYQELFESIFPEQAKEIFGARA